MWPFTRRARTNPGEGDGQSVAPMSFWRPRNDHNMEASEGIFSAVTRLSTTLASTPFHLYRGNAIAMEHELEKLFSYRVAPGMSAFAYFSAMEACRGTAGNGYALKVPDPAGRVQQLDVLDPDKVTPLRDYETGEVWYKLQPASGKELYVHAMEMIHVRQVSTTGLIGVSPVTVLKDALDYDAQMQEFSISQVKGVNSSVVLEFPSQIGQEQKQNIIKAFMENYKASSGNLIVLSGGSKASVINKSPVDPKVLDVERVTKGRIATVYTLPPHMLGNFDKASYGSNEQQMLEFLQLTMQGIYTQYTQEHRMKLLAWDDVRGGYDFRFDTDRLIIPTALQKAEAAQYYVRSGVKAPGEVRGEMGLGKMAGSDTLLVSRDLTPLNYLVNNPEAVRRNNNA